MAEQLARYRQRRGTAAAWTSADPTLADGELGFESDTRLFKIGDGVTAWTALSYSASSGAPTAHAASHQSGGGDAIKLDDLAAPDDNTDLNATTSAHGLLPKLGGGSTNFLRADGTWNAPGGGGTPGGATTNVQYNLAGAFAGDSAFTYNATNKTIDLGGGTVTANDPVLSLTQTWNNGTVAFDGIVLDVTNTASAGASYPLHIKVDGLTKVAVRKDGYIAIANYQGYPGHLYVHTNHDLIWRSYNSAWFQLHNDGAIGLGYDGATRLYSEATGVFAQRKGTASQTYRIYGTYTDASNYERLAISANAITLESAGTGTANLDLTLTPAGTGSVVLPKTSGFGIKVDTSAPTFGWRDIIGAIELRGTGPADPTFATYGATPMRQYQFSATAEKEVFIVFHIPHDYVPGTDIFLHMHWSNAAAAPDTGDVVWGFDYAFAKGFDQAAFPSFTTITVTQACPATRYQHNIAETAAITIAALEVDGLLLVRAYRKAADAADTCTDAVFGHTADVHYQSTNLPTKNKAPNFYA